MIYLFKCQGCKAEEEVDKNTFFSFLTKELSGKFFSENGLEAKAAALVFTNKCPLCAESGFSDFTLEIAR